MPELPEVETTRRRIAPAMVQRRFVSVDVRRPDLRVPFPARFARRLAGQTVLELTRRGKYLVGFLSSGEALLIHLGMSGSLRIARATAAGPRDPHDHVIFHMSSARVVVFNDPRRFGLMDLVPAGHLERHRALSRLGPEPLSADFDAARLARACRGKKTSLKAALLDQRVVAGLGNIYASEALHVAACRRDDGRRPSPRRRVRPVSRPFGSRPRSNRCSSARSHARRRATMRIVRPGSWYTSGRANDV